ncbi:unnamed protein product [Cylicostephanus goldi]|uniref:Uncharacterized protein n=1 Tax=Cylicostephanus goldi TaxID=71465 RepID=A0A3P6TC23_CYLGO|nr:unnamed protein product [Cylicostephanus goldi]
MGVVVCITLVDSSVKLAERFSPSGVMFLLALGVGECLGPVRDSAASEERDFGADVVMSLPPVGSGDRTFRIGDAEDRVPESESNRSRGFDSSD